MALQLVQQLRVGGIRQRILPRRRGRTYVQVLIRQFRAAGILFRKQFAITRNRGIEAGHVHLLDLGRQPLERQRPERACPGHYAEYRRQDFRPDPRFLISRAPVLFVAGTG